jgi:membrane-bound lytic murein transglycosylase A
LAQFIVYTNLASESTLNPRWILALASLVFLAACAGQPGDQLKLADGAILKAAKFSELEGWSKDKQGLALAAFRRSCRQLREQPAGRPVGPGGLAGTVAEWRPVCAAAERVPANDDTAARIFFTAWFTPFWVVDGNGDQGLFTGYFEPLLHGARRRDDRFNVPLYARPSDLVVVDLGLFRKELHGARITGRVVDGTLHPYPSRAEIDGGALDGRSLEIVWVDDPVDAFLLQVQGSGRVELVDGSVTRLGYAASNGHPYVSIGRELVERGAIPLEEVDWPAIRAWLDNHTDEAKSLLHANPSYVFFATVDGEGPRGAQGVALTPGRSLAVDPRFVPLGAPVWLDTTVPAPDPQDPDVHLNRLMVAQDTGGAIKGAVRGDVFWGHGEAAGAIAGRMKHRGRYAILLPKAVVVTDVGV